MRNIRWGVIGVARFGTIHARVIQALPGCELGAICNHNPSRLQEAAEVFPGVPAITDYRRLLEADDIDAVSITTHWQQHHQVAMDALASGKHVLLEKPMAATADQCRELVAAASGADGYFMVGHICRFDPRVSQAKLMIDEGRIGRIVSMHAKRNLPRAPGRIRLDKISPLLGDGIHDADMMMWFLGRPPSSIYARNVRVNQFKYPDLGWAMLNFNDDAVGVVETVWCLPESTSTVIDARMEIVGSEGALTIDCSNTGLTILSATGAKMHDTVFWPEQHGKTVGVLSYEIDYFAECIRSDRAPEVVTPAEAARAVIVMEAAERSALIGQPVSLDHDDLLGA